MSGGKRYGSEKIVGNKILKCVYKMAGHSALNGDNGLKQYYEKMRKNGKSHKQAYNGVCRKIAAISLSIWRNNKKYDDQLILSSLK